MSPGAWEWGAAGSQAVGEEAREVTLGRCPGTLG